MSTSALALSLTGLALILIAVLLWLCKEIDDWRYRRRLRRAEWKPPRTPWFARLRRWWADYRQRRHRAHLRHLRVLHPDDLSIQPDPRSSIAQHRRIIGDANHRPFPGRRVAR